MSARHRAAVLVGVALAVVASTASGGTRRRTASPSGCRRRTATNSEPIVKAANATFQKTIRRRGEHPVPDVGETTSRSSTPPWRALDARRHRDGEHRVTKVHGRRRPGPELREGVVPNSGTWLEGLAASGRYGGKLYGVPYYAGSRVVTYRSDLFKKAGLKVPTSLAPFTAAGKKLAAQDSEGVLAGLHRRHGLVRRHGLRLRLRRQDRDAGRAESGRARSRRRGRSRLTAYEASSTPSPRRRSDRRRARTRTPCRPGPRSGRCSGRPGSAAASVGYQARPRSS